MSNNQAIALIVLAAMVVMMLIGFFAGITVGARL